MQANEDASVVSVPLAPMTPAFPTPSVPTTTSRLAEPKPRATVRPHRPRSRPVNPAFYLAVEALMCLALLGVAALLWYWDGAFTLTFLTKHFPQLATWLSGYGQWLIPIVITILTLASWPRKEQRDEVAAARLRWRQTQDEQDGLEYSDLRRALRVKATIFFVVGAFNLGTSFSGLLIWGAGRSMDLFAGFTIPTAGAGLWAFAGIVGTICSYGPEKISRWALGYLDRLRQTWEQRGRV